MVDNTFLPPVAEATSLARPRAFDTILYGGLAVGVLDGLAAVILAALRGTSPTRVFQYIASGLLGRDSFSGGVATVVLGVLLHFLIAFIVATVYYGASRRLPALTRQALIWGPLYGVAVHFVMRFAVVPMSAVTRGPFSFAALLQAVAVHAVCVGLPVALIARWSAKKN